MGAEKDLSEVAFELGGNSVDESTLVSLYVGSGVKLWRVELEKNGILDRRNRTD